MNITYKSNNNVVYFYKYHVVWCPKYRRKILTNGIDTRLKELLLEYAANISVDVIELEIMPDNIRIVGNYIKLPKLGFVKVRQSMETDKINNVTVERTPTGKYFAIIKCRV